MVHIRLKKGLDLPIPGAARPSDEIAPPPLEQALDFRPFQQAVRPDVLVRVGDRILLGQPLIRDAKSERVWVSPASGTVLEIVRGPKRILEAIRIQSDSAPELYRHSNPTDLATTGLLAHLWMRPFHLPAHPHLRPRSIFIRGLESAPFTPSAELQVAGREAWFQAGLDRLAQIAPVHLVTRPGSPLPRNGVQHHTIEGPHPAAHASIHIEQIDPIRKATDVVWTTDVLGVLAIGRQCLEGRSDIDRVVAFAGEGLPPELRRHVRLRPGAPLDPALISGDPLMGRQSCGFLGWGHTVAFSLPTAPKRRFLHFFRLSSPFTATRTYRSQPTFSTLAHGEERAFIDPNIYDKVMPLRVPTVPFLKALMTAQYETAEQLGLLEVAPEDFALPAYICPSKVDMIPLVENALLAHARELLSLA